MGDKSIGIEPFCGIANIGNICYANSVLQLLWRIDQFKRAILVYKGDIQTFELLKDFFTKLSTAANNTSVNFERANWNHLLDAVFVDTPSERVKLGDFGDAAAFLLNILDKIKHTHDNENIIDIHFGSTSKTTICNNGSKIEPIIDDVIILNLQIKPNVTLQACINSFSEPQPTDESIKDCDGPKVTYEIQCPPNQKYFIIKLNRTADTKNANVYPNKELCIDGKKFIIKGVILVQFGVHFIYAAYENGILTKIIDDSRVIDDVVQFFNSRKQFKSVSENGYIYLYEKIDNNCESTSTDISDYKKDIRPVTVVKPPAPVKTTTSPPASPSSSVKTPVSPSSSVPTSVPASTSPPVSLSLLDKPSELDKPVPFSIAQLMVDLNDIWEI